MPISKNEVANVNTSYQLSNGTQINLNKNAIMNISNNNPNLTDGEISLFIELCKYSKLNPFLKEAYIVKYDNSKPAQMVVSLGALQRIADENPQYDGIEDGIAIITQDGKYVERPGCILLPKEELVGGWAKVYKKNISRPFVANVSLREFTKGQSTWKSMPATMINKCAKVNALRKAFPGSFNGCYTEEEIVDEPTPQVHSQFMGNMSVDEVLEEKPKINTPVKEEQFIETNFVDDFDDLPPMDDVLPPVEDVIEQAPVEETPKAQPVQESPKQESEWFAVRYGEFKDNREKYEMKRDSFNPETKTVLVRLKK